MRLCLSGPPTAPFSTRARAQHLRADNGDARYILDAARMSFKYDTCEGLLAGIAILFKRSWLIAPEESAASLTS